MTAGGRVMFLWLHQTSQYGFGRRVMVAQRRLLVSPPDRCRPWTGLLESFGDTRTELTSILQKRLWLLRVKKGVCDVCSSALGPTAVHLGSKGRHIVLGRWRTWQGLGPIRGYQYIVSLSGAPW